MINELRIKNYDELIKKTFLECFCHEPDKLEYLMKFDEVLFVKLGKKCVIKYFELLIGIGVPREKHIEPDRKIRKFDSFIYEYFQDDLWTYKNNDGMKKYDALEYYFNVEFDIDW